MTKKKSTGSKKITAAVAIKPPPKLPVKFKIDWEEKTVKVSDLKPYENNPREVSDEGIEKLRRSMLENGYHQRMTCTRDLSVIGGHRRLDLFKEFGIKKVKVIMPKREITDKEFNQILIRDNIEYFLFDYPLAIAQFGAESLVDWGIDPKWIIGNGEDETKEVKFNAKKKDKRVKCPKCNHRFVPEQAAQPK